MKARVYISLLIFIQLIGLSYRSIAQNDSSSVADTSTTSSDRDTSMMWKIQDSKYYDFHKDKTTMDLGNPSNYNLDIQYDPETNSYYFIQKIGDFNYRVPSSMTAEEYLKYRSGQDEKAYWQKRAKTLSLFSEEVVLPPMYKDESLFDRIFGGTKIDVRPQGNVDMSLGYKYNVTENPAIVRSQQRYGIPDFNVQMNLGLLAQIGDKIKFNFNYNTKANFDFNNQQLKLNYVGKEDEIIKAIDVGYVDFNLPTKLIQGTQTLFGIKSEFQFGRLRLTNVISQQRSQKKSIKVQGGAQRQEFELSVMDYDENRHFLLAQYFRDNYDRSLSEFPIIKSQVNINRIEVWVTNKNSATQDTREILAFMDLGETDPYQSQYAIAGQNLPDNSANSLYAELQRKEEIRQSNRAIFTLSNMGLQENKDFNKVLARKLNENEYKLDPQIGFISLNQTLQPDQVLAIAMQYTYNGKVYQIGEFSQEVTPDTVNQKLPFLKMLKSTQLNTEIPLWDLMMKNIYNIGGYGINKDNFVLNVMYQQPGQSLLRYLPEGPEEGNALIQVLNLDRLNNQGDPQPDGLFDFIEGRTIIARSGRVIFPILEPFGEGLYDALGNDPDLIKKYTFQKLYDSTKFVAMQYSSQNRFYLQGSYMSESNSEIYLGGFNIPQGSVTVRAGGQTLTENVDYTIDYGIGKVNIINPNLISSGIPLDIQFENNSTFGFLQQSLFGTRADYYVNKNLSLGATYMRLKERPFTPKVDVGEDPINNKVLGADFNYQSTSNRLTRWLDKLPIYSTKTPSNIVASGEVARIIPGHNKLIDVNDESESGTVYLDNFEGVRSSFDLKFPFSAWQHSSVPVGAKDANNNILFPESTLNNNLDYNKNRARLSWYFLDNSFFGQNGRGPDYLINDTSEMSKDYARIIKQTEVFPERQVQKEYDILQTLDLAYYPDEKGVYNYSTEDLGSDGRFINPRGKWGGMMRAINYNNFEASNIEYIEIWMLDPYGDMDPNNLGSLYIDIGNVSEDILKDSRKQYENGLPYPPDPNRVVASVWGNVPRNQQQLTNAFDTDPDARAVQDAGLDGINDEKEKNFFSNYLTQMQSIVSPNVDRYNEFSEDPSADNFKHYTDQSYTDSKAKILERYSKYNNPQGNSATTNLAGGTFTLSSTNIPDAEDLNRDNTLNEAEEYYQYRIDLKPNMEIGENHIVNIINAPVNNLPNNSSRTAKWYQFKIPIRAYDHKVGNQNDFRSIRFMRMFLTGFEERVVLRFAKMDLTRSQWRKYAFDLDDVDNFVPVEETPFVIGSVSLEENANSKPVGYVVPPGVFRQLQQVANGVNLAQNEQSLSYDFCELPDGQSRAAFRELNYDLRQFKKLKMYVHAESKYDQPALQDGDVEAFIRLGTDMSLNYYEYSIPLKVTLPGATDPLEVWPEVNNMDIYLDSFIQAKLERDRIGFDPSQEFVQNLPSGKKIKVRGVPNFGQVKNILIGVRNKEDGNNDQKCGVVWVNELRLADMIQKGGYAATGDMSIQLADLGAVNLSGGMHTAGYGNINQKVNERYRNNQQTFNANTNLNIGKLLPSKWGVQWPLFMGTNQNISTPQYDPYDKDVLYQEKLQIAQDKGTGEEYKASARTVDKINTISMQGIKIIPVKEQKLEPGEKPNQKSPISISNFDFGYSMTEQLQSNPLLEKNDVRQQRLNAAYNYSYSPKYIYPLKKILNPKSKNLLLKDFNINLLPNSFNVSSNMFKQDGETLVRDLGNDGLIIPTTYNKFFTWDRRYGLQWDLTKSISINYTATNQSRIDQPNGLIDTQPEIDSVRKNILSGGRTTNFNQTISAAYNLPFKKVPVLSFIDVGLNYKGQYNYIANSLLAQKQGNTIANNNNASGNARMNFLQLYNKNKKLRKILNPRTIQPKSKVVTQSKSKKGRRNVTDSTATDNSNNLSEEQAYAQEVDSMKNRMKKLEAELQFDKLLPSQLDTMSKSDLKEIEKQDKKIQKEIDKIQKWLDKPEIPKSQQALIRFLIMPQNLSFNYNRSSGTNLPGWMSSPDYLGLNASTLDPGWEFVSGWSPSRTWLMQQAQNGLISSDTFFVAFMSQNYTENYRGSIGLVPFNNVRLDLDLSQNFTRSYSSLLKDSTFVGDNFNFLSMMEMGSFTNTFIGISSLFSPISDKADYIPGYFREFLNNRIVISERLSRINPYSNLVTSPEDPGFYKGYTRYSQDVIIPALLAAFTGQDPKTIPLVKNQPGEVYNNPFRSFIPMPNWKLRINSLQQWGALSDWFTNLSIDHAYTGTVSMNGMLSNLTYDDIYSHSYPSFIDSNSGNFVPYFFVPNITITEAFRPLLGLNMATKSGWDFSVDYKASTSESLSLIDLQISENKSSEYSFSVGKRWKEVRPVFGIKASQKWKGDLNLSISMSYRNNKQSLFQILNNYMQTTGGQKVFGLSPNLDYIINQNFTFRFYFDMRRIQPHFGNAFNTSTTRGGVTLRYTFTQ